GVVVAPHLPVQLQGVRRQFLGVVPEQAHAAVGLQRAVLDVEAAGAGLLPAVQGVAVEDRPVALGRLAVGLDLAGGVLESAEQVGAEGFLGVGLLGVAAAGVEGAAAAVVLAPGDRVVALHGAALVGRLVQGGEDLGLLTRVGAVVVPLVGALPGVVQVGGGRVVVVLDAHGGLLDGRVRVEVRADEAAVELPVVLGVGGGVDAHVAAAVLDVALERLLLVGVQDVTGGGQEGHRVVLGEVGGGELAGLLGRVDGDAGRAAEFLQRGDALRDGVVAEAGGLGEDQDLLAGLEGLLGELEVVDVVERAVAAAEDEEDLGGLLRQGPQRDVDVLERLPAAGRRDVRGAVQLAVG